MLKQTSTVVCVRARLSLQRTMARATGSAHGIRTVQKLSTSLKVRHPRATASALHAALQIALKGSTLYPNAHPGERLTLSVRHIRLVRTAPCLKVLRLHQHLIANAQTPRYARQISLHCLKRLKSTTGIAKMQLPASLTASTNPFRSQQTATVSARPWQPAMKPPSLKRLQEVLQQIGSAAN